MNTGQLKLGQLIDTLKKFDTAEMVVFDFGGLVPTTFDSYRGYYEDLALGFDDDFSGNTVGDLLKRSEACIGKVFTGYKGGEYTMSRQTDVWVANDGEASGTGLMGVEYRHHMVVLVTDFID